jgi:hypothetical protein
MKMRSWGNFLGYQAVWFIAVIGAGLGLWWPGFVAAIVFVAWQLRISLQRGADLRLLATALALGSVIDGVLAASGWAVYAANEAALPPGGAPLWILALWASFSTSLNTSLRYLRGHLLAAAALGAVGGPLAYAGAARGWHALEFAAPAWHALAWLSCGWAVAMPLLAGLARRWTHGSVPLQPVGAETP